MKKRKTFPQPYRALYGLTPEGARVYLVENEVLNHRNGIRITLLRVLTDGGVHFTDQREERLNVFLEDGKITATDGPY